MKKIVSVLSLMAVMTVHGYAQQNWKMQPVVLSSRWAKNVSPVNALKEYPRPQMVRTNWQNLNGLWDYAITQKDVNTPSKFDGKILVPYPLESALSGVQKTLKPDQNLWYKRSFQKPALVNGERLLLNFGAVDWQATVFVNGKEVGKHQGGYTSFSFDITDELKAGANELVVKVFDPTDRGFGPSGKQTLNPQNIYYTASSGIWQTAWLEKVPAKYISGLKTTPDIDKSVLNIQVNTDGSDDLSVEVIAKANGVAVGSIKGKAGEELQLPVKNARLWSPDDPFLYNLTVKLIKGNKAIDEVSSYFGMRKISLGKDDKGMTRIFLNNKYTFNLGTLDQGFWPDGLYTAPTDEALAFDIKAIKSMGFNTIRKHIKVEPARWYYHADKAGVMVWQDFVNPNQGLPQGAKEEFEKESKEIMDQLHNATCITTWVLFNERWGAYDQKRLTEWVKQYDPSRLVNGHTGELLYVNDQLREPSDNPYVSSDMTDVHSYPDPINSVDQPGKARVVGEFGGIGVSVPGHEWNDLQGWGYVQVTAAELKGKYSIMTKRLKKLEAEGLSASIYTQPFDVEGEENGLLTYDRQIIKIPVAEIRSIHKELVPQTKGFALNPDFVIAQNINVNDNDSRYDEFLSQYKGGKKDSAFLRRLALMAIRKKDQATATMAGNDFIKSLKDPYSKINLNTISQITRTSADKGFELFKTKAEKIDAVIGEGRSASKVKKIIDAEEIEPHVQADGAKTDWDAIQKNITSKYGAMGEEFVLGKRMIFYLTVTSDWKKFGEYYVLYFEKALTHPEYMINNVTWPLFEHEMDPKKLEFGIKVMKYCIEKWDQSAEAYDTYANLLHKVGRTKEAIEWEEQALKLKKGAPDEKVYSETLDKMNKGRELREWNRFQIWSRFRRC